MFDDHPISPFYQILSIVKVTWCDLNRSIEPPQLESKVKIKKFKDSSDQSTIDVAQRDILSRKISDLALKIQGTCLENSIKQLYQELEKGGISLKPKTYLSDEWGCPQGVPVIGIPFYLADPGLCRLETQLTGIETETEAEVMMFLRHEAGHAFNYAYRLYRKAEWRQVFGKYSQPYQEVYKPLPFSARFVHHVPGWYAQKHPDDDFAETFAVWLTPGSDWRKRYAATPALTKLLYVDKVVSQYGRQPPAVIDEQLDKPVQEMSMTLDSWYETNRDFSGRKLELHPIIDQDLQKLFPETDGQLAAEVLQSNRIRLIRDVNYWTGMDRHILESLFNELAARVRLLDLKISADQIPIRMISLAILVTTLAMNYQFTGKLIDS
jgi:hypothetical protein